MFFLGRHKNHVAGLKRICLVAVLKKTLPADDHIDFILRMWLLEVFANRFVNFDR